MADSANQLPTNEGPPEQASEISGAATGEITGPPNPVNSSQSVNPDQPAPGDTPIDLSSGSIGAASVLLIQGPTPTPAQVPTLAPILNPALAPVSLPQPTASLMRSFKGFSQFR